MMTLSLWECQLIKCVFVWCWRNTFCYCKCLCAVHVFDCPCLRCDVALEEGEHQQNCLCATVLSTIVMVHSGTSSSYSLVYLSVFCLPLYLRSSWCYVHLDNFYLLHSLLHVLVSWTWWDWPLTCLTNHSFSVLWHCWLGHLPIKLGTYWRQRWMEHGRSTLLKVNHVALAPYTLVTKSKGRSIFGWQRQPYRRHSRLSWQQCQLRQAVKFKLLPICRQNRR